eukprot:Platyproteum_vivax@DN12869_c0_g1_i1.p1
MISKILLFVFCFFTLKALANNANIGVVTEEPVQGRELQYYGGGGYGGYGGFGRRGIRNTQTNIAGSNVGVVGDVYGSVGIGNVGGVGGVGQAYGPSQQNFVQQRNFGRGYGGYGGGFGGCFSFF